jgi:hypothetical protein
MNRENLPLFALLILTLVCGLWIGQRVWARPERAPPGEAEGFRQWFWENRSLDLLVQAGLIFGGALGIAALLPGDNEDHEE